MNLAGVKQVRAMTLPARKHGFDFFWLCHCDARMCAFARFRAPHAAALQNETRRRRSEGAATGSRGGTRLGAEPRLMVPRSLEFARLRGNESG
jgi:hypothetical protein